MRSSLVLFALLGACHAGTRPSSLAVAPQPEGTEVFALYKFLQRIGMERTTFTKARDGGTEVKTTFTFNDRGTDVSLGSLYRLAADGSVARFEAWGTNARGAPYDVRVAATDGAFEVQRLGEEPRQVPPAKPFAVASGYAPVIGQELMVQAWLAALRPSRLRLLPEGEVAIESRGKESFTVDAKPVALEHLAVRGLVWGREDLWIDEAGKLAGLVTRDAEFDHFEAIRADLTPAVEEMVARAGADAVAWLGEAVPASHKTGTLALVGARLVDGTGAKPVEDAVVLIEGDRIRAAGPRGAVALPADAERIDLSGKTIVPGLWDMHAHVQQVEQMAAYLAAGVTTVRDVGNILPFIAAIRDSVEAGKGVGPRVLVDPIFDGEGRMAIGTLRIAAREDIVPMLDKAQRAGATEIKIYSSLKPALVAPVCAEAHRRGLKVTGHVPNGMNVLEAIEAGFDGVNHVSYAVDLELPAAAEERQKLSRGERRRRMANADLGAAPMQKLFALAAARHTTFDPTIALYELLMLPLEELKLREPGLAKMPPELRGAYAGGDPADATAAALFRKSLEIVGELHKHGVPIVAGTDIGVPGHSLHRELELYVEAGFTPMEALQAATLVPARAMGKDGELGTIAAGKRADVVVLDGDPLADIHAIRRISLVIARGRPYQPAPLWKIAGFAP